MNKLNCGLNEKGIYHTRIFSCSVLLPVRFARQSGRME